MPNSSEFDVETGDEYVDAVRRNVRLSLAGDQVQGLSVSILRSRRPGL